MPDDVKNGEQDSAANEQDLNAENQNGSGAGEQDSTASGNEDIAKLKAELSRARSEAAKFRTELKTVTSERDTLKQSQMTDTEKQQEQAKQAELKASLSEERALKANLKLAATAAGMPAEVVADLVFANRGLREMVSFDDEGNLSGAKEALEAVQSRYPELVRSTGENGNAESGKPKIGFPATNPGNGQKALTKADIEKMSPQEINERWDDVSKVLSTMK